MFELIKKCFFTSVTLAIICNFLNVNSLEYASMNN